MVPRPQGDVPFQQCRWAWQCDCSGSRGQGLTIFLESWYIREREILPSSLELWYAKDSTWASSLCLRVCCECSTQSNRTWCFIFTKIPLDFDVLWSWKSTLCVAIWCPHVLRPLAPIIDPSFYLFWTGHPRITLAQMDECLSPNPHKKSSWIYPPAQSDLHFPFHCVDIALARNTTTSVPRCPVPCRPVPHHPATASSHPSSNSPGASSAL